MVDGRQKTGSEDRRWETETGGRRWETGDERQEMGNSCGRQET